MNDAASSSAPQERERSVPRSVRSAGTPSATPRTWTVRFGRRTRTFLSSLRLQLLWWFVAVLAIATIVSVLLVRQVLLQRVDARIDAELQQEVEEIRRLASGVDPATAQPFGGRVDRIFDVFLDRNVPNRSEVLVTFIAGEVYRASGEIAPGEDGAEIASAWAAVDEVERGRTVTMIGDIDYLAVPFRVDGEPSGVFVVAIHTDALRADTEAATLAAASVGVVMLALGSFLAGRLADRILRPVALVTRTARSISESDLTRRIAVSGHDEISELATTFNAMLGRLEAAFETQRRFIDDAGHELRTPVTIIRGHLDVMGDDPDDRARTMEIVSEELDRISRLVDDLLTLARADRPDFVRPEPTDVARLTAALGDKVRGLGPGPWSVDEAAEVVATVDPQRVTEAVLQVAENASRYSPAGTPVTIGSAVDDGVVRFWVRDEGPGFAPDELDRIFDRFHRGAASRRTEGSGLGLSIVRAIAEAHGGRVEVRNREPRGATVTIVLPRERVAHR